MIAVFHCRPSLPTTQIVQMENPADFIPTGIPEKRNIPTPHITHFENKNRDHVPQIASPIQTKEQRPQSSSKRPNPEPALISSTTRYILVFYYISIDSFF